jgi:hypothetical protein
MNYILTSPILKDLVSDELYKAYYMNLRFEVCAIVCTQVLVFSVVMLHNVTQGYRNMGYQNA